MMFAVYDLNGIEGGRYRIVGGDLLGGEVLGHFDYFQDDAVQRCGEDLVGE